MATLAADSPRQLSNLGSKNDLVMVASDIIYEGAIVGLNSGVARPLVAGDPFAGICNKKADNASGAQGDVLVEVWRTGDVIMPVTGVTGLSDIGSLVYASDDDTLTLTSTSNTKIGKVVDYVSGTTCRVRFTEHTTET